MSLAEVSLVLLNYFFISQSMADIKHLRNKAQEVSGHTDEVHLLELSFVSYGPGLVSLEIVLKYVDCFFNAPATEIEPCDFAGLLLFVVREIFEYCVKQDPDFSRSNVI